MNYYDDDDDRLVHVAIIHPSVKKMGLAMMSISGKGPLLIHYFCDNNNNSIVMGINMLIHKNYRNSKLNLSH